MYYLPTYLPPTYLTVVLVVTVGTVVTVVSSDKNLANSPHTKNYAILKIKITKIYLPT